MLPRALNELWEGMEENRRITLGMLAVVDKRTLPADNVTEDARNNFV